MPHLFSEALPDGLKSVANHQRYLLEELYRDRRLYSYANGESIWMEPEEVWVVCRGVVLLSVLHPSGDEVLLGLAGPSMPFGLPFSVLSAYNARALSAVDLLCLPLADVEASPVLAQNLFRQLSRRLRQTEAVLALSGHRRIEERLRHLLLLLKEEIGQPVPQGTRLNVKLTHQQLASAIGTSRVTITRLLGKLRQEGWVCLDRDRHIVIAANAALI